jgi:hypothetical protein
MQADDAMGVDPAQIGSHKDISSDSGINFWDAPCRKELNDVIF